MARARSGGIRLFAGWLVLAAIYAVTGKLALMMGTISGVAGLIWPPSAIALVALLNRDRRLWPGITIGAFALDFGASASALAACFTAAGSTLEPVLGAWVLDRFFGLRGAPTRIGQVLALVVFAALGATTVSASFGTLGIVAGGVRATSHAAEIWWRWWLGDATGVIVLAPVLLAWTSDVRTLGPGVPDKRRVLEAVALGVSFMTVLLVVFTTPRPTDNAFTQTSVIMPFLVWAALRFGMRGATAATLLTAIISVWGTVMRRGPYVHPRLATSLLFLQVSLSVVSITTLVLAVAVSERDRAAREAKQASRVREEFLSIASHELHTPLTSLVLSVQLLLDQKWQPPGAAAHLLDVISRQVQKLTTIVSDLLVSTRLHEHRLPLQLEAVDLSDVVREVVGRVAGLLRQSGSSLTVRATRVICGTWDRARIEQIFTNLLSNAVKFGAGKPIELTIELESDRVARIVVQDHGIGIPTDRLPRVFDRFEQAVTDRHYGGLGLGLYIVHSLVELHHGTITVDSTPEYGSTFTVRLPIDKPATGCPPSG